MKKKELNKQKITKIKQEIIIEGDKSKDTPIDEEKNKLVEEINKLKEENIKLTEKDKIQLFHFNNIKIRL